MTAPLRQDLAAFVKAYDVRGVVPDQLDDDVARALGAAFVRVVGAAGGSIVVGHDMRPSSPGLVAAFAEGATAQGADVVDDRPRVHRPAVLRQRQPRPARRDVHREPQPGAATTASSCAAPAPGPVGQDTGLAEIRDLAEQLDGRARPRRRARHASTRAGPARRLRRATCAASSTCSAIRPLKVVVDAGNGMGGHTVPTVLDGPAACDLVPLYFELDGTFPNHEANPLDPANLVDLQAAGAGRGRRPRPGLRRRRRPLLRGGRARRAGLAVGDHRAGRRPRARRAPRRRRSSTT